MNIVGIVDIANTINIIDIPHVEDIEEITNIVDVAAIVNIATFVDIVVSHILWIFKCSGYCCFCKYRGYYKSCKSVNIADIMNVADIANTVDIAHIYIWCILQILWILWRL